MFAIYDPGAFCFLAMFDEHVDSGGIIDEKPLYVQQKQGLTTQVSTGNHTNCQRRDRKKTDFGRKSQRNTSC
jgi:hypothetical protein